MSLQMRGVEGELRRGYQVAAHLGPWSMDERGVVEATPASISAHWLDGPGALALWLRVGRKSWVWRDVEMVSRDETRLVVRVAGSPAIRD